MWWWGHQADPEVEAALSRVRIFASLPPRDLRRLAALCLVRRYDAGEVILEEGSPGLGLVFLTSGRVEVFKTHDHRKIHLAVLGRGDVLGEMSLLDDEPRSASAVALEPAEGLLLTRDHFRTLIRRRPRIAWPIVPALAERLRELQAQLLTMESQAALQTESPPPDEAEPEDESGEQTKEDEEAAPAADSEAPAGADTSPADDDGCGGDPDLLRAPYALVISGAVGFGESLRLLGVFFRSLDEESGLSGSDSMVDVVRRLPASCWTAGRSSWEEGRRLPSKILDSFRDHLRRDED